MSPEEIAEKEKAEADKAKADVDAKAKADADAKPPQDNPIKAELDRVKGGKKVYTEAEKAAFNLLRNAEKARELGVDPLVVLGDTTPTKGEDDDDKPVTVGMLKKQEKERATKSALQLASDAITDEHELELTQYHIENTIKPSGNAQEDLSNARAIVNSVKNKQIAEDASRKTSPKTHNSSAGAPAKKEDNTELTAEESSYMKPPFNLTKAEILAARPK